jgi:hypothetical protein
MTPFRIRSIQPPIRAAVAPRLVEFAAADAEEYAKPTEVR